MVLPNASSVLGWRAIAGLLVAVCLGVSTGAAVARAGATSVPGLGPQEPDPLKFTRTGRMLLVYQVAPDKAQDFALTWREIRNRLATSGDSDLAAFSRSLRISRVETAAGAAAVFVFDLDPVSTTYSYHPVTLLFETLAADPDAPGTGLTYDEATALYEKIKDATAATWWLSTID